MTLRLVPIIVAVSLATGSFGLAEAMETDQFMTFGIELADASEQLNRFVNDTATERLARINQRSEARRADLPCTKVARYILRGFRKPLYSRVAHWGNTAPGIERFPSKDVPRSEYYRASILGVPFYSHFNIPLGRTVNINGVYLGTDKLGHFLSFGARYYKQYLHRRADGLSSEAATMSTIEWGLRLEKGIVGGWTTGITSFADLEANYQGLLFARSLCEGGAGARLFRDKDYRWHLDAPIDVVRYINPDWDESFNTNVYARHRWRKIRARIARHCDGMQDPQVQARYRKYLDDYIPSENTRFMRQLEAQGALITRERYSLERICETDLIATQ
jgi:hypothetical protein